MKFQHFVNKYPYTDFHELNLDWIIGRMVYYDSLINGKEALIFNTHEQLINSHDLYEGQYVVTRGYYAPGDCGHSYYYVADHAETAFSEEITAGDLFITPLRSDFTTPQLFGAVSDGTADTLTAIKKCVEYGLPVYFPPGVYLIDGTLNLADDTCFIGHKDISIIKLQNGRGYIYGDGKENLTFNGMSFDYDKNINHLNISIFNSKRIIFRDCEFFNGCCYSARLSYSSQIQYINCYIHDMRSDNMVSGGIYGIGMTDLTVDGCVFDNLGDHAVYLSGDDATTYRVRIVNNYMTGYGADALTIGAAIAIYTSARDVSIINNQMIAGRSGILATAEHGTYTGVLDGFNISDNVIKSNVNGILFRAPNTSYEHRNGIIKGNYIRYCTQYAAQFNYSFDIVMSDNVIKENALGLQVINCQKINISNLTTTDNTGTGCQMSGVSAFNISGVIARDNAGYGLSIVGASSAGHITNIHARNNGIQDYVNTAAQVGSFGAEGAAGVITFGTSAPTIGYHEGGNICINSAPSSGAPVGWICTTAGTPGTWTALQNL